jgi:hypothetical protein
MTTFPPIHGVEDPAVRKFSRATSLTPETLGLPTTRLVRPASHGLVLQRIVHGVVAAWKWIERKRVQQTAARRLRVTDTISLGDKRFVSIVQVDGAQFLIGGATGSISLLAILDNKQQATGEMHQVQGFSSQEQS